MEPFSLKKEQITSAFETKYIKVFDIEYEPGKHYYDATRHSLEELTALKTAEDYGSMLPDAVSCVVIVRTPGKEERILLSKEFRYPAGQYLLSVPAGLIDPADRAEENPLFVAAKREIHEETGIVMRDSDKIEVVSPFLFSTPGMTDESNGIVCAVIDLEDESVLNQSGAEGSEKFDGFTLLNKADARRIMKQGRDDAGIYYSVYTWIALAYFVGDFWKE